ncbi:phage tail protein [Photobacterium leiognathi subsp. mandapamensis]
MTSLNSKMVLDTRFLTRLSYLPDELAKAAKQAVIKTNRWLRAASMADLGYELKIDAKAMTTRFRIYKNGGTSKLWVGVRNLGVHRIGTPVQNAKGVQYGAQGSVEKIRALIDTPQQVSDGQGMNLGKWTIQQLKEGKSALIHNGQAMVTDVMLQLKEFRE